MDQRVTGHPLVAGTATGPVLASREPLSFWGGWNPETGEIIDRRHPLSGRKGSGTVLAIPFTRGSSTTTAILLESIRAGTAPAAVVCTASDPFLALAAVVAGELFGARLPVVQIAGSDLPRLAEARTCRLLEDGTLLLDPDA